MVSSDRSMDYTNLPDASGRSQSYSGKHSEVSPAFPGRKLYMLVAISFGVLCILQVALNISLHNSFYSKTSGMETPCKNGTEETLELKKLTDEYFQQGWIYFRPSFYYISSVKKSWQESRDDCLKRGADLVIINSKEEQLMLGKFHKILWIGLSDEAMKGTWKWVDGTLMTKSYWGHGEPNDFEGKNENCVEIKYHDVENGWNDIPCEDQNFWICEKMVTPKVRREKVM
ncbi:CD209 antigen-like protein A [Pholidichthys leucotaenia]